MSKYKANTKLINQIKDKFGSIQRFIKESGMERRTVRINLYRDSPAAIAAQEEIARKLRETPKPANYRLTLEDRRRIRLAIMDRYHNVSGFTRKHPEFSDSYMSYLLGGTIKCRKGKAEKVMRILKL